MKTFLFAGGGSGGHISPGLAIAERLGERDAAARTVFVCSQRAVDRTMLEEAGVAFEAAPASPPMLRPGAMIRFAVGFLGSVRRARALLRRRGVTRVVAMGGFVSAPVVMAARLSRIPVTLVNLDAPPGRANRWIARRSDEVFSALAVPGEPRFSAHVVGMPVRRRAIAAGDRAACRRRLGLDPSRPTLLVTGASQGARSINQMLAALVRRDPDAFHRWQVLHLCGAGEVDAMRVAYRDAAIPARLEPFLHEMGLAWGSADLAVSRAGASSVAEAWANGVPTLFLPYPFHHDRHQHRNAEPMAAAGGAIVMDDLLDADRNADTAGAELLALVRDESRRERMRESLRAHPAPDGAGAIAERLLG